MMSFSRTSFLSLIVSALLWLLSDATHLRASSSTHSNNNDSKQVVSSSSVVEPTTKLQLRKLETTTSTTTHSRGGRKLLSLCEGDCDRDSDCEGNLVCWHRGPYDPIPGCSGGSSLDSRADFCINPSRGGDDDDNDDNGDDSQGRVNPMSNSGGGSSMFVKMYWEPGYHWQGDTTERKWCMRCYDRVCGEGTHVVIKDCDTEDPTPMTFDGYGGREFRMRVSGGDMCVEMTNDSDKYAVMQSCSDSSLQRWVAQNGDPFNYERFQITPKTLPGNCLTQTHDPKDGEPLWVASCEYAEGLTSAAPGSDTSYFNFYSNGESIVN